jgi:hypothetical protein
MEGTEQMLVLTLQRHAGESEVGTEASRCRDVEHA